MSGQAQKPDRRSMPGSLQAMHRDVVEAPIVEATRSGQRSLGGSGRICDGAVDLGIHLPVDRLVL